MSRTTKFVLCVVTVLLAGAACAEEPQWLQYRFSRNQAAFTRYGIGISRAELTERAPRAVRLPKFSSEDPLFARWKTPMVKRGYLLVAFDRTAKTGPHDRLYIDADADGSLADEKPIEPFKLSDRRASFGPVRVLLPGTDGPVTYHLVVTLYDSADYRRLYFRAGGWYQGNITVAGTERPCFLFDYNCNGTFDDATFELSESDHIVIDYDGTLYKGTVGGYLQVKMNGELLRLEVARDGACVKLTSPRSVKMGTIEFAGESDYLELLGDNGFFRLKPVDGKVRVPVGTYRINQCHYPKTDGNDVQWKLLANGFPADSRVKVRGTKVTRIVSSEPVRPSMQMQKEGRGWRFSQDLKGQSGEQITFERKGQRPPAPRLRIKNSDGSYERVLSFEYG